MTDWSALKEAFWTLSDLDPAERARRLEVLASSEPELHRRLAELLAADASGEPLRALFHTEPSPDEERPTRIGTHDVVGVLGSGGMGEVYRAHDARLQRDVAIKILPASMAADRERLAAFEREARVLASLNHPHIAQVFGLDDSDGAPALIMELVEGPTLADVIAGHAEEPIPLSRALTIARQIADGLDAAHERGVVHRDLKPANIALTSEGEVKILDFGIAERFTAVDPLATRTAPADAAAAIGTPAYMSPEQARGLATDRRTDIWAFGCVLYELLTGRRVFEGTSSHESVAAVLERAPDLSLLPTATPAAVRTLLRHCLEKDPKRRQRDIGDVRLVLDDVLQAPEEAPARANGDESDTAQITRGHRPGRLVAVAGLSSLVAVIGAWWMIGASPAAAPAVISSLVLPAGMQLDSARAEARFAESTFAVSPDGRRLVVVAADASGVSQLWVRSLASPSFQPLAGTQNASYPFWSSDSDSIAFVAADQIRTVGAGGGAPVTVAQGGFRTGAWSSTGVVLFAPQPASPLYLVPATGGEPRRVTTLNAADGEVQHVYPSFLPDGEHFLYLGVGTKNGGSLDPRGIYVSSLAGTVPAKLLVPGATLARYANGRLLYIQESRLWAQGFDPDRLELRGMPESLAEQVRLFTAGATGATGAFSVSDSGVLAYQTASTTTSQPTWFDRTGRRIAALGAPGDYGDVALSPDGTRLAVSMTTPGSATRDLWIYDGSGGARQRFTFDPGDEFAPVWSPDATRVLYSSFANGSVQLFVKNANGLGESRPLAVDALGLGRFAADWSREGLVMYIGGGRAISRSDLWIVPVDGAGDARPILDSTFLETHGRMSPDGQSFVYASNETGQFEVYVDRFPNRGARRLVSRSGGGWPRWSRDGRAIYFLSAANQLMVATLGQDSQPGEPRPLFDVRARPFVRLDAYAYDVSPDGTRVLVNALIEDAVPPVITLVANWTSLLSGK